LIARFGPLESRNRCRSLDSLRSLGMTVPWESATVVWLLGRMLRGESATVVWLLGRMLRGESSKVVWLSRRMLRG
jgi:hypothetical protein